MPPTMDAPRAASLLFRPGANPMPALDLTISDLTQVRFGMSPMSQLLGALLVLGGSHQPAGLDRWRAAVWDRYQSLQSSDASVAALVRLLDKTSSVRSGRHRKTGPGPTSRSARRTAATGPASRSTRCWRWRACPLGSPMFSNAPGRC